MVEDKEIQLIAGILKDDVELIFQLTERAISHYSEEHPPESSAGMYWTQPAGRHKIGEKVVVHIVSGYGGINTDNTVKYRLAVVYRITKGSEKGYNRTYLRLLWRI